MAFAALALLVAVWEEVKRAHTHRRSSVLLCEGAQDHALLLALPGDGRGSPLRGPHADAMCASRGRRS